MLPDEPDSARLWDMLTYSKEAVETVGRLSFEAYFRDKNLRLATERRIEIIGEAARNVSERFQAAHPEIPWQKIVAQRHVLAHEYGDVRQELVWRVVTVHLPELIAQIQPLLPASP